MILTGCPESPTCRLLSYLTIDIAKRMENTALYGGREYRTCPACSWTGKKSLFEPMPVLLESLEIVRCPYCGGTSPASEGILNSFTEELPEEFTIISGGQTGVDRAALDAAIMLGIPHGGWCPKGRKAEDGIIAPKYNLREHDDPAYWKRTEQNILDSDGTLVMPGENMSKGTALTIKLARKHGRPTAIIPLSARENGTPLMCWLNSTGIKTLNVAGPRESVCPGIGQKALNYLLDNLGNQSLESASRTSTLLR